MKHTTKDVRVDERSARPDQREHLKVAFEHVVVERRELGSQVEVDADSAEIFLHHGRLEPRFLIGRDLERESQTGPRSVAVGVAIARLIEETPRQRRVMGGAMNVRLERPRLIGQ